MTAGDRPEPALSNPIEQALAPADRQPIRVGIVMKRTPLENRWQSERWEPVSIVPDDAAEAPPRLLREAGGTQQWLHRGFIIELFRDEAEGYYLNLTSAEPYAFVHWELVDGAGVPRSVTLSYNEAARMMDGGAQVDGVPLPMEVQGWLAAFVDAYYRPEPKKKRIRPPSFKGAQRGG
jgi:hypothetical protein